MAISRPTLATTWNPRPGFPLAILACLGASVALGASMATGHLWLGIVALIGGGCALLALAWPEAATLGFVAALYINLPVIAVNTLGLPSILAAASFAVLLIPLAGYVVIRRQPVIFSPTLVLMLIYLLIMLLSALIARRAPQSLKWIGEYLTEGLLLFVLVINVVRTYATLRRVVWALILAGAFLGALTIHQEVTHSYDQTYGGFAQMIAGGFKVGEDIFGEKISQRRIGGPLGETNRYAQIMLILVPLALFRFWGELDRRWRALAAVATVLILGGTLLTYSRGAMAALAGVLLLLIMLGYIRLRQAILLTLVFGVLVTFVAPQFFTRIDSLSRLEGLFVEGSRAPDGAVLGRLSSNLAALGTFVEHPVTGVGPGQYYEQYSMEAVNDLGLTSFDKNRRAHNMYLEVAADTGILGLGALLSIVGVTVVRLWRARQRWRELRPEIAHMATGFMLAIVAYMASAVFLHLSYQRYFWLLLALANAAISIFDREAPLPSDEAAAHLAGQGARR